jgi:hypothetical protein
MTPLSRALTGFCLAALAGPSPALCGGAEPATDATSEVLLGRPLFEPDRRPKGAAAPEQNDVRLTGIAGSPGHWVAIFAGGAPDAKNEIRTSGQTIGDWTIASVTATAVTLSRDAQIRELKPNFVSYHPASTSEPPARKPRIHILSTKHTDPHLAW